MPPTGRMPSSPPATVESSKVNVKFPDSPQDVGAGSSCAARAAIVLASVRVTVAARAVASSSPMRIVVTITVRNVVSLRLLSAGDTTSDVRPCAFVRQSRVMFLEPAYSWF